MRKKSLLRWLLVVAAVVAVAAIAVAVYSGLKARERKTAAEGRYEQAIRLIERAEPVLSDLDDIMESEISSQAVAQADDVIVALPDARKGLENAVDVLKSVQDRLPEDLAKTAGAVMASAHARMRMIDAGSKVLSWDAKAAAAVGPAREGWQLVLDAEQLADQAAVDYNKHTRDSVKASMGKAGQARAKLDQAKARFQAAQEAFEDADMKPFIDYCERKKELLSLSEQIDVAWLGGRLAQSNKLLTQYNEKEKALVELAKALPASETAPIAEAYDAKVSDDMKAYYSARDDASVADAGIKRATAGNE